VNMNHLHPLGATRDVNY